MRILGTEVTAKDMRSADLHSRQIVGELSTCGDSKDKYQRKWQNTTVDKEINRRECYKVRRKMDGSVWNEIKQDTKWEINLVTFKRNANRKIGQTTMNLEMSGWSEALINHSTKNFRMEEKTDESFKGSKYQGKAIFKKVTSIFAGWGKGKSSGKDAEDI